jgi:hypothetical protein
VTQAPAPLRGGCASTGAAVSTAQSPCPHGVTSVTLQAAADSASPAAAVSPGGSSPGAPKWRACIHRRCGRDSTESLPSRRYRCHPPSSGGSHVVRSSSLPRRLKPRRPSRKVVHPPALQSGHYRVSLAYGVTSFTLQAAAAAMSSAAAVSPGGSSPFAPAGRLCIHRRCCRDTTECPSLTVLPLSPSKRRLQPCRPQQQSPPVAQAPASIRGVCESTAVVVSTARSLPHSRLTALPLSPSRLRLIPHRLLRQSLPVAQAPSPLLVKCASTGVAAATTGADRRRRAVTEEEQNWGTRRARRAPHQARLSHRVPPPVLWRSRQGPPPISGTRGAQRREPNREQLSRQWPLARQRPPPVLAPRGLPPLPHRSSQQPPLHPPGPAGPQSAPRVLHHQTAPARCRSGRARPSPVRGTASGSVRRDRRRARRP